MLLLVEECLLINLIVVQVVEVGEYGGIWYCVFKGLGDCWGLIKLMEECVLKWFVGEDGILLFKLVYIESYLVNEDVIEFIFILFEGLKWLDGYFVIIEDVEFWYNDIFLNIDIVLIISLIFVFGGVLMEFEVVDDWIFIIKFVQLYVYFLIILVKDLIGELSFDCLLFLFLKYYLIQFYSSYISEEELVVIVEEYGVEDWIGLWGFKGVIILWWLNLELLVIIVWMIEMLVLGNVVLMVWNLYYYVVD